MRLLASSLLKNRDATRISAPKRLTFLQWSCGNSCGVPAFQQLAKFARLENRERSLLVKAFLVLALARTAIWLLPLRAIQRILASLVGSGAAERNPPPVRDLAWSVNTASRLVPRATCLVKAVALQGLLSRAGRASRLHIGVARGSRGGLDAHAWIECGGMVVLGGAEVERYSPLLALEL